MKINFAYIFCFSCCCDSFRAAALVPLSDLDHQLNVLHRTIVNSNLERAITKVNSTRSKLSDLERTFKKLEVEDTELKGKRKDILQKLEQLWGKPAKPADDSGKQAQKDRVSKVNIGFFYPSQYASSK